VIVLVGSEKAASEKHGRRPCGGPAVHDRQGHLLADADPQQTSLRWAMARKAHRPDAPAVESASLVGDLRSEITKLAKNYDHIVIDCGGSDSMALRSGMLLAHRMIIPSRVARRDIETLQHVSQLVAQANAERTKKRHDRDDFAGGL